MEDNIYTLKSDIQQCIANNIDTLKSNYRIMLFEDNTIEFTQGFNFFENLKIKPNGAFMNFEGKIAKDLNIPDENLDKIKKIAFQRNMQELAEQIKESNKTETQRHNDRVIAEMKFNELLDDLQAQADEEQQHTYKQPKKEEIELIKKIQTELKKIGLDLDYEVHDSMLMLCGNFEQLEFTKEELRKIVYLSQLVDTFLIAPFYGDEEDDELTLYNEVDECQSIRIVFGLYLEEE